MAPKFNTDEVLCPLCCEELDLSDKNFLPCSCGYQVCMWCWHHIKENLNGLCPACRSPYSDNPHIFAAVDRSEVIKSEKSEKRRKKAAAAAAAAASRLQNQGLHIQHNQQAHQQVHQQQKGSAISSDATPSLTLADEAYPALPTGYQQHPRFHLESMPRKNLVHLRVIQKNLVYVTGLHVSIVSEAMLRKPEYFGQYGRILKLVVNTMNNTSASDQRSAVSASAYVTFQHADDARACIRACDGFIFEGRQLKANYGTSKYCNAFVNNKTCSNHECLYLHSLGNPDDCYTKDEIQTKNLLATPLSPRAVMPSGGGGPSGSGKQCANPVFPAPTYATKGAPPASRGGTQSPMTSPPLTSMPSAAAGATTHWSSGNSVVNTHNMGSNSSSTSGGGTVQPQPGIKASPNSATTPWTRGATKSPVLSSVKPHEKNGAAHNKTTSNAAWPSLGEAAVTAPVGGWGGSSYSSPIVPSVASSSTVRKVKGKDNNGINKSEAVVKEPPQRPGGTAEDVGYLQGQGGTEQPSQSRAEVQAQAHAQMLQRQQAYMRAQAEIRLQNSEASATTVSEGGCNHSIGGLTPGRRTKTRTLERQNIKPTATVVTITPPTSTSTALSSEDNSRPGATAVTAMPPINALQSYSYPSPDPSSNADQISSSIEKNNQLLHPPGLGQGPTTATAMFSQDGGDGSGSMNNMFNNNVYVRSGRDSAGSERDINNDVKMTCPGGSVGSRNVTGMTSPANSHNSSSSVAVSSVPPPPPNGRGGDTETKNSNLANAMDGSIQNNSNEYPPRSCDGVYGRTTSSLGENQSSRSFGRAFSSALFPASTFAGFGDSSGGNTRGSDLSVDPYSKNGTSVLAALLGVILPPVDSQGSLASSYRMPLEQLPRNTADPSSTQLLHSGMHR